MVQESIYRRLIQDHNIGTFHHLRPESQSDQIKEGTGNVGICGLDYVSMSCCNLVLLRMWNKVSKPTIKHMHTPVNQGTVQAVLSLLKCQMRDIQDGNVRH